MGTITDNLVDQDILAASKTFEQLENELGANVHQLNHIEDLEIPSEEDWEIPPVTDLSLDEIAEIAHNTVAMYKNMMWPQHDVTPLYEHLSDHDKGILKNEIHEIMQTANDPNDIPLARVKYAQEAMRLLSEGYSYAEEINHELKHSPEVVPWEYLKNNYRLPYLLFRDVAKRLITSVWSGV